MRFFYFLSGEKGGEGRGMGEVEASASIEFIRCLDRLSGGKVEI